jgi:CDP-glycerol glycerophosphotransferase (TagB/SpsB family)
MASSKRLLFYVEQDYSFAILRPLQAMALGRGHQVRWLVVGAAASELLGSAEQACVNVADAVDYGPDLVFAPGDRIPAFVPGLKVCVFHGLNEDKRGNIYPDRGQFDLYCTEGPNRTNMLAPLAEKHGYFKVRETGWLKLDSILNFEQPASSYDRPQVLYASTFTPRLSSAEALYAEIKRLSQLQKWRWLVTLHPKIDVQIAAKFKALQNDNLSFHGTDEVIPLLHRADVMVSDNSSVLQEFLLLGKPVVTYKNRDPQPHLINIQKSQDLEGAIESALKPDSGTQQAIGNYKSSVTSFLDGKSASRILDAAEEMHDSGWRDKKPLNLIRNLRMRRQLSYYRL